MAKRAVSDQELAAYRPRLEQLAVRFAGRPFVDHDDLVQEGWILVWEKKQQGFEPTDEQILARMAKWARTVTRQRQGIPKRARLPKDDPPIEVVSFEELGDYAAEE